MFVHLNAMQKTLACVLKSSDINSLSGAFKWFIGAIASLAEELYILSESAWQSGRLFHNPIRVNCITEE